MNYQGYYLRSHHGWQAVMHPEVSPEGVFAVISPQSEICADPKLFQQVESSGNARVFIAALNRKGRTVRVFVKHYLKRSVPDCFKNLFRGSRGRRAFHASLMLRENGFNAPLPLALIQKESTFLFRESVLVTEESKGRTKMAEMLAELARQKSPQGLARKRSLITQFGDVIGRMHARGIIHGDLRMSNVFVEETDNGFSFWFIDNESTRRFSSPPARLVRKNLVQMNKYGKVSNTDRLRFLKAYCRGKNTDLKQIRPLITQVLARTLAWRIRKKPRTL